MTTLSEEFRNEYGFHSLDASTISFVKDMVKMGSAVMSIIDTNTKTVMNATFQKHCKFAIKACDAPKDEVSTFRFLMAVLITQYDVPANFFACNKWCTPKPGLFVLPNEYDASIRLWCSRQVGKNVVYELTLSCYKDAVPQPM
jgi:hypothetical protein